VIVVLCGAGKAPRGEGCIRVACCCISHPIPVAFLLHFPPAGAPIGEYLHSIKAEWAERAAAVRGAREERTHQNAASTFVNTRSEVGGRLGGWVGGGWVVLRAGGWGCTPLGDIMFSMWARIAVMEAGARPPHLPDCAAALPLPANPFPAAAPWPCHSLAPAPLLPPAEAG
jgi:hypothetical protein